MARTEFHYVYLLRDPAGFGKVGTARNPTYRIEQLQCGNPRPLETRKAWRVVSRAAALEVEAIMLDEIETRIPGRDWFNCEGASPDFFDRIEARLNALCEGVSE